MGWLSATPEGSKESRYLARKKHLQEHEEVPMPPLDVGAEQYINYLSEAGMASNSGMGIAPLEWQELESWLKLSQNTLTVWEVCLIHELSQAYVSSYNKGREKLCPAPWAPVEEVKQHWGSVLEQGLLALLQTQNKNNNKKG